MDLLGNEMPECDPLDLIVKTEDAETTEQKLAEVFTENESLKAEPQEQQQSMPVTEIKSSPKVELKQCMPEENSTVYSDILGKSEEVKGQKKKLEDIVAEGLFGKAAVKELATQESDSNSTIFQWLSCPSANTEQSFSHSLTGIVDDSDSYIELEDAQSAKSQQQIFQEYYYAFAGYKKIEQVSNPSLDSSLAPTLTDSVSIKFAKIELDPDTPLPELQKIPEKEDFRAYFELDSKSIEILQHIAFMPMHELDKEPPGCIIDERLTRFMMYFYESRVYPQETHFHWYMNEGFFAAHMLIKHPSYLDKVLPKSAEPHSAATIQAANDYLMKRMYAYVHKYNNLLAPLPLTGLQSYYLLTGYIRMLLEGVTQSDRPILERRLLRARFAAHVLEHYIQECNSAGSTEPICSKDFFNWSLRHEARLHLLLEEPLHFAQERLTKSTRILTPNIEEYRLFYKNGILPRPDALAINPEQIGVRKYDVPNIKLPSVAICPVQGCGAGLCERNLMSHFVTHHCRRWSELYPMDRLIYVLNACCYTPEQVFCLYVMGLQTQPPISKLPRLRQVRNLQLPSNILFLADHLPCLFMHTQIFVCLNPEDNSSESGDTEKNSATKLYVFWFMTRDDFPKNTAFGLHLYSKSRQTRKGEILDVMPISAFQSVPHMLLNYASCCLIFDNDAMKSLTDNFTQLILVDIKYVYKDRKETSSVEELCGMK